MKVLFVGKMAILLFLVVWFIGCEQIDKPVMNSEDFSLANISDNPTLAVSAAPAGYWHMLTDGERNQLIIDKARSQIGCTGGQCKEWVQNMVLIASWNTVWLPKNYEGGGTYYLAKWDPEPSTDVQVILRGTSNICSYWCYFKPGQIVQMRHNYKGATPHTMIIETLSSSGFYVLDSNWDFTGRVSEHWIPISWFRNHLQAWTVYQVK